MASFRARSSRSNACQIATAALEVIDGVSLNDFQLAQVASVLGARTVALSPMSSRRATSGAMRHLIALSNLIRLRASQGLPRGARGERIRKGLRERR